MQIQSNFPSTTRSHCVSIDDYLRQAAKDIVNILNAPEQNIPSLTYGSPTTNAYIHLAHILKQAIDKLQAIHSQLPVKQIAPKPRVVKQTIRHAIVDKIKAVPPPRVANKTSNQHPLVAHRQNLLSKLRQTKCRLNRLIRQAVHAHTGWQAQSTQQIDHIPHNWACPVFHPDTGRKQSLDGLLQGQDNITWTTSLTNEIGSLSQGIGKNRPLKE